MIIDNLAQYLERISLAAKRTGRSPDDITLVAVTKNVGVPEILLALDSGIRQIGESRVHEALLK